MYLLQFLSSFAIGYYLFASVKDQYLRSDVHAISLCFLSLLNIYTDLPMGYVIGSTSSFMIFDLTTLRYPEDIFYILHHIVALIGYTYICFGDHRHIVYKSGPYVYMIESSVPFLNKWLQTRDRFDYFDFIFLFVIIRIIYLGYMVIWLENNFFDFYSHLCSAFYVGMCLWFAVTLKNNLNYLF